MPRIRTPRRLAALAFLAVGPCIFPASGEDARDPVWTADQKAHWAFLTPKRPEIPKADHRGWDRNPIDAFLLRSMTDLGVAPAAQADKLALIRRVTFDLCGLPPSGDEIRAFLSDDRPEAYERLVDRLLASPAYGERYARFWLDLARYAESDGYRADAVRPNVWRYRDWVIQALNRDMPYDEFVRLQLAGDEVAPDDKDALTATAFHRHVPYEYNNMTPGLNRQLMLDDMTDTTTAVFLGLTVACARCHDHKYDAISQKDYYRIQAVFAGVKARDDLSLADPFQNAQHEFLMGAHQEKVDAAQAELDALEGPNREKVLRERMAALDPEIREAFATAAADRTAAQEDMVRINAKAASVDAKTMKSMLKAEDVPAWEAMTKRVDAVKKAGPAPLPATSAVIETDIVPPVHLMEKGSFTRPGPVVNPGFLSVLCEDPEAIGAKSARGTTGRRLALANWITRPEHPLTARVMVNRLWLWHFGRGLVATPSDFGTQGAAPSDPELLDWLASELVAQGWRLKPLHRLMVTSAAYKQTSLASAESVEADPDNVLFCRSNRRRLEAEAVRDAILAVSGQLDLRVGGPSVFPDLPEGVAPATAWPRSPSLQDRNRRSVYVHARRNIKYPLFDAFDSPDTNMTCPDRNVSVSAPQALTLLNSKLVVEYAQHLAGRVLSDLADQRGEPDAQIERAFELALGRHPSDEERRRALSFLETQVALLGDAIDENADLPLPPLLDGLSPARGAALVDFCHSLLNVNEFVFVD